MAWFRRNARPPFDGELLLQGEDMISQLASAHRSWGLGSAERWGLDQRTGLITWTFDDRTATAPAQILASHNAAAGSWMWAWANPSILPELSRDSETLRAWGQEHEAFTEPKLDVDDELAATLSALAVRVTHAQGFYRGTGGASTPIITFGPVTLTTADGHTQTFKVDVGD